MSSQKRATSEMANEIYFLGSREKEDFSWERRGSFELCKDDMKLCLYKNVLLQSENVQLGKCGI